MTPLNGKQSNDECVSPRRERSRRGDGVEGKACTGNTGLIKVNDELRGCNCNDVAQPGPTTTTTPSSGDDEQLERLGRWQMTSQVHSPLPLLLFYCPTQMGHTNSNTTVTKLICNYHYNNTDTIKTIIVPESVFDNHKNNSKTTNYKKGLYRCSRCTF